MRSLKGNERRDTELQSLSEAVEEKSQHSDNMVQVMENVDKNLINIEYISSKLFLFVQWMFHVYMLHVKDTCIFQFVEE